VPYHVGYLDMKLFQNPQSPFSAPHHWFGTDVFGHDFLTQSLVGIRETIFSALACAGICVVIGVIVGALAGYYGGWLDAVVSWVTAVVVAVPAIVVLMVVLVWSKYPVTPLGNGLWLCTVLWAPVARVVWATVRSLRYTEFAEAARASGASSLRILVRHLLPNASGSVIVAATSLIGQEIIIVATVNYLGYSVDQNTAPTLGGLIGIYARYVRTSMILQFGQPYITVARAKGLPERQVVVRHALRNSLVPFTSLLSIEMGGVIGASLAADGVFGTGGLASAFLQAVGDADPFLLTAIFTVTALIVCVFAFVGDIVVGTLDPRMRVD